MRTSLFIGSLLIVVGTAIGAGILALPMVSAKIGFSDTILLLVAVWALLLLSAFLLLEVNLAFPVRHNSFSSMTYNTLGKPGQIVAWISCLLLLYALTSAYIAGNTSLLTQVFASYTRWQVPAWCSALGFTVIFGGAVFWSTRAVDLFNRGLISLKGVMLLIMLGMLLPHINVAQLVSAPGQQKYIWAVVPIFVTAFGYHTTLPSLSNYLKGDVKTLKRIIMWGSAIPLVLYTIWLACALGIVPLTGGESFATLAAKDGSVGEFIHLLTSIVNNKWVSFGVNGFSNIAMTTSFLGVTLGLFDFLADGFKRKNTRFGRFQTALLTFIPPLIFALYYPQGFIAALGYAGISFTVLAIILPPLMVYRLRHYTNLTSPYRVPGGNAILALVLLAGIAIIALQL